jgi:hypothetical protein
MEKIPKSCIHCQTTTEVTNNIITDSVVNVGPQFITIYYQSKSAASMAAGFSSDGAGPFPKEEVAAKVEWNANGD